MCFRHGHCLELEKILHHPIESKLFLDILNKMKIEAMCFEKNNMMLNENQEGKEKSSVGYIQIFKDKTAKLLNRPGLAVHFLHAVLLYFSNSPKGLLIWNGLPLAGLLSVRCSESGKTKENEVGRTDGFYWYGFSSFLLIPLSYSVCLRSTSTAHEKRVIVLQEAMSILLRPLCESIWENFSVEYRTLKSVRALSCIFVVVPATSLLERHVHCFARDFWILTFVCSLSTNEDILHFLVSGSS